jgi:hypothetical protein
MRIPTSRKIIIAGSRKKPIVQAPRITKENSIPEKIQKTADHSDFPCLWIMPIERILITPIALISMKYINGKGHWLIKPPAKLDVLVNANIITAMMQVSAAMLDKIHSNRRDFFSLESLL